MKQQLYLVSFLIGLFKPTRFVFAGLLLALVCGEARADAPPATTDNYLMSDFNLDAPGMEKVKVAVEANDLPGAQKAYLDYRRMASRPKWIITPADQPAKTFAKSEPLADD